MIAWINLICHSPFWVIYSFIWVQVFYWICVAEERDLVLRYEDTYIEYHGRTGMFLPKGIFQIVRRRHIR